MTDHIMTSSGHALKITPPTSIVINMTKLDEICERAQGYREIVLNVDGEEHHYRTEDVLEILKQIEL